MEKTDQLVAERCQAARLQYDDRRTGSDMRTQRLHRLDETLLREVQHPVVIQRPPAAHVLRRHLHATTGSLHHLGGGDSGLRTEIVGKGIEPEYDVLTACRQRLFRQP